EKAAGIQQGVQAFPRVQDALGAPLGKAFFPAHGVGLVAPFLQFLKVGLVAHGVMVIARLTLIVVIATTRRQAHRAAHAARGSALHFVARKFPASTVQEGPVICRKASRQSPSPNAGTLPIRSMTCSVSAFPSTKPARISACCN